MIKSTRSACALEGRHQLVILHTESARLLFQDRNQDGYGLERERLGVVLLSWHLVGVFVCLFGSIEVYLCFRNVSNLCILIEGSILTRRTAVLDVEWVEVDVGNVGGGV